MTIDKIEINSFQQIEIIRIKGRNNSSYIRLKLNIIKQNTLLPTRIQFDFNTDTLSCFINSLIVATHLECSIKGES